MRRKARSNVVDDSDESGSETADSDKSVSSSTAQGRKKVLKRRPGRPPTAKKKRRLQDNSDRDASPQPSTSQNVHDQNDIQESDDSSSSEDSDFGPVHDKSPQRKKAPDSAKRRVSPCKATGPKKSNSVVNGISVNSQRTSVNGYHLNPSQRKKSSQPNDVSLDAKVIESLAQKLVYFLLIEDQKKYAIRKTAIRQHVFKDHVYSPKHYAAVIAKANNILKKTFGMELMELENQKDSYLIVNILRHELDIIDYVEVSRLKQQQHGLILYILTVIFMNENLITEDELSRSLKVLGIDLASKRLHPVFGDVKKYITTELVKQMYVQYECISKDPPKYEFSWGLRAKQEFDKRDLLRFVCQIMDDTSPEDWRMQYKDAESSAKQNADS